MYTYLVRPQVEDIWNIITSVKYYSSIESLSHFFAVKENNSWECKFIVKEPLSLGSFDVFLPVIYVVTPTYSRPTQKADLTRMSHTLMHIPNLHWIVVEDGTTTTKLVENLLNRSSIRYTHLYASTPTQYKLTASNPRWLKPRGVQQRNAAIDWLRTMISKDAANGVVYFGDDDNTYDLDLFNEVTLNYVLIIYCWIS